jgi:hypothetical protein
MPTVDAHTIPRTYDEAVRMLASWHGEGAEADFEVFSFPDSQEQIVRLVEVSDALPTTGSAQAFPMGRSADFPFRSAVVFLTHEEWRQARSGKLRLPEGWDVAVSMRVWPHE